MITLFINLFLGASLVTSVALVAACMLSGRTQAAVEADSVMVSVESLRSIAEVELPKYSQRRQRVPVHAGI